MNSFHHFFRACSGSLGSAKLWDSRRALVVRGNAGIVFSRKSAAARLLSCRAGLLPLVLLAGGLALSSTARAQAVPDAYQEGYQLSAGGTASAYDLDYGEVKKLGASVFVDIDGKHHFGGEGEARWLSYALKPTGAGPAADERATTYLAGPRYFRDYGRFEPYVKGLIGIGTFHFPYNLATDNCLVIAPGAGVDFRLTRRISWRAADVEYQFWPQFEYGTLKSYGVSSGIRIQIF